MAKKLYVSNSTESPRMFKNDFLESLTKIHYTVPLIFWVPVICYFIYKAYVIGEMPAGRIALYFLFGLAFWTLAEYVLHRWVFHYYPKSAWGQRIHFIFHGVHHDYPKDRLRLVMPLSASIPMAAVIYFIFSLFFTEFTLAAFFSGFILGYLIYDECHYAMHHANFKSGLFKKIKDHHMLHHYSDPERGFGVSSALWDIIFDSGFRKKETKKDRGAIKK
ncbi:fatty acid hydroxylase family protein [Sphingobacterium allocomposti]|uniref:Fatty acid hydroxylase family protein n=1 Tax=Sphingobacterium allocomposti TaxID=415956 RepID=A0A5S5CU17_9SPHI|nr:sterol desaturase family protein [Sphingobacterium composti Yoo et al. 2007 non Ten et al. 2007]TYP87277.1 fatty acid hydroxylase family protein [Sphingobacterium composti Yoo et al. 2007 non Ten et al. 2007]